MLDTARLALVYVHLIACCIALGAILSSDAKVVARLIMGRVPEMDECLRNLHRVISAALVVLWATGVSFVWMDASSSSLAHTLSNPKLQAKVIVVMLLTLNGFFLNARVLPLLSSRGSLLKLHPGRALARACCRRTLGRVVALCRVFRHGARCRGNTRCTRCSTSIPRSLPQASAGCGW